ncbi:MAG TPA: malto-oligosyltrehalose trehalohydrolase [Polyangia bacterium]|jgi:maltooligosyltrehalose trehalohydrolase
MREEPERPAAPFRLGRGATALPDGGTRFSVWAPRATSVAVKLVSEGGRLVPLARKGDGVHEGVIAQVGPGADYAYVLDGDRERPDPVSRWQPQGVHGPSRVVDPRAFRWTDDAWRGLPVEALVLYELHVGTFTPEGTFDAVIGKLPYLRLLGVNAIAVMPVAEFPGGRNWGYDGAHLYAPQSTYGGPEGLRRLVDACHAQGLALVLDVVYNHLGPEGTYLAEFGPYFTDRYRSPWGDAVNYDGPDSDEVRRYVIDNALYWQTELHVDGLRLDAVHGIYDLGARHVLEALAAACHAQADLTGRPLHVIAESDLNDVRVIRPVAQGGYGVDAQWLDDFHHALHVVLTGRRHGYLNDFGRLEDLAKALREGYVYDGRYSGYRRRTHGNSSADRPGRQLVAFTQNHDQVANAAGGARLGALVGLEQEKLAAAVLLAAPYVPMLFMGQEWGEEAPFQYFTSVGDPALARAIREGRQKELAGFGMEAPDPQAESTYRTCRLRWDTIEEPRHTAMLRLYRDLLRLRRVLPALSNCRKDLARVTAAEGERWLVIERGDPAAPSVVLACNFAAEERPVPLPSGAGGWRRVLWTPDAPYGGPAGRVAPPASVAGGATLPLAPFAAVLYRAPG